MTGLRPPGRPRSTHPTPEFGPREGRYTTGRPNIGSEGGLAAPYPHEPRSSTRRGRKEACRRFVAWRSAKRRCRHCHCGRRRRGQVGPAIRARVGSVAARGCLGATVALRDRRMTGSGRLDPGKAYLRTSQWRPSSCLATVSPAPLAGIWPWISGQPTPWCMCAVVASYSMSRRWLPSIPGTIGCWPWVWRPSA